jgi:hypothetical protein
MGVGAAATGGMTVAFGGEFGTGGTPTAIAGRGTCAAGVGTARAGLALEATAAVSVDRAGASATVPLATGDRVVLPQADAPRARARINAHVLTMSPDLRFIE